MGTILHAFIRTYHITIILPHHIISIHCITLHHVTSLGKDVTTSQNLTNSAMTMVTMVASADPHEMT